MAAPLKILYVGPLDEGSTALHRLWALERAGQQIIPYDLFKGVKVSGKLANLNFRIGTTMGTGPMVWRINREVLRLAREHKPDVMWGDKLLHILPKTLDALRAMGILTVNYSIDNPFGPRRDPDWGLYMKCISHYDLHVVQRDQNVIDYKASGARDVLKIQTAYEPTLHFPPPAGWSDNDRDRGVSFIGTPYDERPAFLTALWKQYGLPVVVSGGMIWKDYFTAEAAAAIYCGRGPLFAREYREGIWRSRINLSFLTHSNQDEFAHKSFEIAACGGFLLVERSAGHLQRFKEDEEAVFFSDIEECVEKIRRYLPDEAARSRIAAAGCARAERDGYHNDRQVSRIVERVQQIRTQMKERAP